MTAQAEDRVTRLSWFIVGGAFGHEWGRGSGMHTRHLPMAPTGFTWRTSTKVCLLDSADHKTRVGDLLVTVCLLQWNGRMASSTVNVGVMADAAWVFKAVRREARNLVRHVQMVMGMDPWAMARVDEAVRFAHGPEKISVA